MARANVDDARRALLTNIIETYLPLKAEQQEELRQMIAAPEAREIQAMISVYEKRGIEIGIDQGKRESLLRQMRRKFGDVPDEVIRLIEAIKDSDEVDRIFDRVVDGATLEDLHFLEA